MTRNASTVLATIVATAISLSAKGAESPPNGEGVQAEVQIELCAPPEKIVRALELHPRGNPIKVWQFDDTALTLFDHGLRLRLRVAADGRSEFTLKVADQNCSRVDRKLVPSGEGKCEYDVYGTATAGAVSLNRSLDLRKTNDLLVGRMTPVQVLSKSQIRYLRDVVGAWPLPPGISELGPMKVQTYRTKDRLYDIDISQLPSGEQFAEISRKVPAADASRTMRAMKANLASAGVEMCADQSSQAAHKLRALLRER